MTETKLVNPDPRPQIPVGGQGEPSGLATYVYNRVKDGPKGPIVDLVAIGPTAVNKAVRGAIETNSKLSRHGLYLAMIPTTQKVERRVVEGAPATYSDSTATVLVLVLKDMD